MGCTGIPSIWRLGFLQELVTMFLDCYLSMHPSIHPIDLSFTLYTLSSHTLRFQHVAQKNSSFAAGMFCLPRCHWIKNFSSGSPRKAPHPHRPVTNFLHQKKLVLWESMTLVANDVKMFLMNENQTIKDCTFCDISLGFLLENCLAPSSSPSIHSIPTSDSSGRLGAARATPLQNIS